MKEKPVLPLLVSMALPNVISMLVNSLYNIVDSLFVARISEDAMTALSLVFPIQNFANAIAIGGYGSVFWMWLIALVGGATAFVESTLAQIYKKRSAKGGSYGGPSYYIQAALGSRSLGIIFAIALITTTMAMRAKTKPGRIS